MLQPLAIPNLRAPACRPTGRPWAARVRLLVFLPILFCFTAPGPPAVAWTAITERAILARALGTMPRPLRVVLTRHRDELYRSATAIPSREGLPDPDAIAAECEKTVRMIRDQRHFALTARQLGRVGVLVAATADPYLSTAGSSDPDPTHQGFELFTERMLHLIPFVVIGRTGFTRQDLLAGRIGPAAFLRHGFEISAAYLPDLKAHLPAGARGLEPWAAFDARSTPFGIASISVSRGASRVSAVWQWIWERAGGAPAPRADRDPAAASLP